MFKLPLVGSAIRRALLVMSCTVLASSAWAVSVTNNTSNIVVGGNAGHRLGAWTLNFAGSHTRSYDNTPGYYRCDFDQTNNGGGYDITIGRNTTGGTRVDSCPVTLGANSSIDKKSVTGNGYWWSGYKAIISSTEYYSGLDGQWECYIVENSSLSSSALVTRLGYLTYQGQATYDGSNYKHYKGVIPGSTINQMWSIRDNYRDSGWCSVGYIQQKWRTYGVPNNWNLGWGRYVEFAGKQKGYFEFKNFNLPWNQSASVLR
jgi:hypothetical protein